MDQNSTLETAGKRAANRLFYLDHLRASLTALVICHHCNSAYGSIGGWFYVVKERGGFLSETFATMFAGITQAFFMSSFFLLSAYFTPGACDHKGPWAYMKRRLMRLGIPILAYYFILSVLLRMLVGLFQGQFSPATFSLSDYVPSAFHLGPLWFAWALLLFEGAYLLWRWGARRWGLQPRARALPTDAQILAFILGIGLFTFVFRQWWPLGRDFLGLNMGFCPLYVCMFVFGVLSFRSGWFEALSVDQANRWFYAALAAIALMPLLLVLNTWMGYSAYQYWSGPTWQCYVYAAWEPWLCVGINMKLIVFYRERLNVENELGQRMARSAFTAYIIHTFIVSIFTYLFTFFSLGRVPEILLMWPFAVVSCFLVADRIRRIPLLRSIL